MLLVAIMHLPYGYYQILRWAVCAVGIYVAYMAYRWGKVWATWVFGFVAALFNPIIPVHLTKEIWQPIDGFAAVLFLAGIILVKGPAPNQTGSNQG